MPLDPADRDATALFDIADSARWALAHAGGLDKEQFLADVLAQDAAIRRLLVIGEAVKRVSPELQADHPAVPWSLMARMRDRLVHHYDEIDLDRVWEVLDTHLRPLVAQIEALLPPSPPSP